MTIYLDHAPRRVFSRPLLGATALLTAAVVAGGSFYLLGKGTGDANVVATNVTPLVRAPLEPIKIKPAPEATTAKAGEAPGPAKPAREAKTDGKTTAPLNTRLVKTITVRPDGSVIEAAPSADAQKRAQGVREALATGPAAASITPFATSAATPPAAAPASVQAVAKTVPPAATSAPVQAVAKAAPPAPEPVVAKAPMRVDTTPVASIRQPAPPAAAPVAAAGSGFAVQLAAAPTEDEARRLAQRFQAQYSDNLGRRELTVQQGVVKDKAVYRVRLADLSKDEANAVCARLRGGNAACFVARD